MPVEEIAKQDKVNEDTVRRSINAIQMARGLANREEMELAQFSTIIALAEDEQKALKRALNATEKDKKTPDLNVQLRAATIINEKIAALAQKGKGTNITVGVGVNNGQQTAEQQVRVAAASRVTSFEEIIRKLDQDDNMKALPEAQEAPVIDMPVSEALDGVRTP